MPGVSRMRLRAVQNVVWGSDGRSEFLSHSATPERILRKGVSRECGKAKRCPECCLKSWDFIVLNNFSTLEFRTLELTHSVQNAVARFAGVESEKS